jgi:hypothetical protein
MKRIFRGGSSGKGRGRKDSDKPPPPSPQRQPDKARISDHYNGDNNDKTSNEDIVMMDVEGEDGGMVMVGEERDVTLPLSGARVMIVTEDTETRREMMAFITALGGSIARHSQHATHALWATASSPASNTTTPHREVALDLVISDKLRRTLWECQTQNIPVVSSSWLERMSGLREGEHWSEINVDPFVPPILAMMGDYDDDGDDDIENSDIGMEDNRIRHDADDFLFVETVTEYLDDDETTQEESVDYTLETVVVESISPNGEEVEVVPLTTTTTPSSSYYTSSSRRSCRRDPASRLSRSIAQTFSILTQEAPDQMEEEAIRRAMELSLLDSALVFRKSSSYSTTTSYRTSYSTGSNNNKVEWKPHDILGVTEAATPKQIKSAYRKLALKNHPDKGGSADQFEKIARAYRSLLSLDSGDSSTYSSSRNVNNSHQLKGTAHWDSELQDHRRLVQDLFQAHGSDIDTFVAKQVQVLQELNLTHKDAGATNVNENDELIHNSCFYLSLAASYLGGIGALVAEDYVGDNDMDDDSADRALIGETALQLKRIIEAAVVKAHPEWAAQGMVGEEVQAFSDFLVYTLDSSTLLSDWAVVVFDTTSGFCDVYKGQHYMETLSSSSSGAEIATAEEEEGWGQSNTLTLRYIPGHYQPLIRVNKSVPRPALKQVLEACDRAGVFYVVTDGAA